MTRVRTLRNGRSVWVRGTLCGWLARGAGFLALAAVLFVVGAGALLPRLLSGVAFTMPDDSMAPRVSAGDVAVTRGVTEVCSEVGIGNVIAFVPSDGSEQPALQRVVSKSVGSFPDGTHCRITVQAGVGGPETQIQPAQVRGLLAYRVPMLGSALGVLGGHRALTVVLLLVALGGIGLAGQTRVRVLAGRRPRVTQGLSWLRTASRWVAKSWSVEPVETTKAAEPAAERVARVKPPVVAPAKPAPAPPVETTRTAPEISELDLLKWDLNLRERELALREARFAHTKARLDSRALWAEVAELVGAASPVIAEQALTKGGQ